MINLDKYIGIPYKNKGRDFSGCDCFGLVKLIYQQELKKSLIPADNYSDSDNLLQVAPLIKQGVSLLCGDEVDIPQFGDIVVFKLRGVPSHIGMYVESNKVIHIMRNTDSCIERLNSKRLKGRVDGFYRIRESYF